MNPTPPRRRKLDWREVHDRLARVAAATERALAPTPEQALALMNERARTLALVPPGPPGPSEFLEIANFTLALQRYAIETRYIAEVVRLADFTPVPGSPEFFRGVLNLRGEILDLIDLRAFLGIVKPGLADLSRVIVLGVERAEFGLMVDAIQEVTTIRVDEVFDAPGTIPGRGRSHLRGVTADARIILDGAALIRDEGLYIDQGDEPAAGLGS
jgi:purine-binding chemotaxis protein CheW